MTSIYLSFMNIQFCKTVLTKILYNLFMHIYKYVTESA